VPPDDGTHADRTWARIKPVKVFAGRSRAEEPAHRS
jgi:hypothetical protein